MRIREELEDTRDSDTEITLGLKSILGIFFGLALICGVFFGFGYSLGRSNHPASNAPQIASQTPSSQTTTQTGATPAAAPLKTVVEPAGSSEAKPAAGAPMPTPALATSDSAPQVTNAAYTPAANGTPATAGVPVQSSAAPATAIMVQIAAVSRPEDASVLVSALRNLGYSASVHSETSDNLLHIQIGPFATRQEALAMRAKLISDGYNAILK